MTSGPTRTTLSILSKGRKMDPHVLFEWRFKAEPLPRPCASHWGRFKTPLDVNQKVDCLIRRYLKCRSSLIVNLIEVVNPARSYILLGCTTSLDTLHKCSVRNPGLLRLAICLRRFAVPKCQGCAFRAALPRISQATWVFLHQKMCISVS